MTLTARQQQVLTFINEFIATNGYPPSRAEIASAMSIAGPSANKLLHTLEKNGAITLIPNIARGISVKAPV